MAINYCTLKKNKLNGAINYAFGAKKRLMILTTIVSDCNDKAPDGCYGMESQSTTRIT